ncbi:amidohydrolase [Chloroflexota bacterium]
MDRNRPTGEAIAVKGEFITFIGKLKDAEALAGQGTREIDCKGKTIMPGFHDAHCHLFSYLRRLDSIDLSPPAVKSITDIKEAVRNKAAETPRGAWISGTGYNEFYLVEKRYPNRKELDEAAPEHPVIISHHSLHACVLNSQALTIAGISAETPDPSSGLIERDTENGEPTGILYEMRGYLRDKIVPTSPYNELAEGIKQVNQHFLSLGITSLQDASITNNWHRWEILSGLISEGRFTPRVTMMPGEAFFGEFASLGLVTGDGDNRLRLGAVKIMLSESSGSLKPSCDELHELAFGIHRSGFQIAFHAITEGEVNGAVNTLDYISRKGRLFGRRHRIEHCAECPPTILKQLAGLPIIIVTQPAFLFYNGERYLSTVPRRMQPWLYRIGSLLKAGIKVAGSSDTPVVPANPLSGICAAVTRRAENGQELTPKESIEIHSALSLYTTAPAYASFSENRLGTITPGKLADMILLSEDPTNVLPEHIPELRVEKTILGGKVVWEAA